MSHYAAEEQTSVGTERMNHVENKGLITKQESDFFLRDFPP